MSSPAIDLCQIPAGAPPEGQVSNFVNPPTLAPVLISVMSIMVAWGALFTGARLYLNFRRLRWGDYCVTIALAMSIATLAIQATDGNRFARHLWDIPACFFDARFTRFVFIPAILFQLGAFFAKTSIFLLFFQLFTVQKPVRVAIWSGQAFNFLVYAVGIAIATYYETPHAGERWEDTLDGRTVIPVRWWQLQSVLTILLDLYIFILPLPVLMTLRLPAGRRTALMGVFSVALLGIGASIASLVERIEITNSTDQTWIAVILSLCSAVELNVAIIVSSAPAFANFTRGHLVELSMVKSLISIFTSSRGSSRSKLYDPEVTPSDQLGDKNPDAKGAAKPPYTDPTLDRSHRYYELNDTWMLKSGATVDQDSVDTMAVDGGIVRTVAFEQQEVKRG